MIRSSHHCHHQHFQHPKRWENNKIKVFTRLFSVHRKTDNRSNNLMDTFFRYFFVCPLEQHNETLQFWLNTLARHQAGKPTTYPSYQLGNYNTLQIFWDLFCTTVTHCVKPPFLSKKEQTEGQKIKELFWAEKWIKVEFLDKN